MPVSHGRARSASAWDGAAVRLAYLNSCDVSPAAARQVPGAAFARETTRVITTIVVGPVGWLPCRGCADWAESTPIEPSGAFRCPRPWLQEALVKRTAQELFSDYISQRFGFSRTRID